MHVNWENAWGLGGVGEYSFFVIFNNEELPSGFRSPFIEEYYSLLERSAEILENTIFYQPENPNEKNIGTEVSFYTEDLYGNSVNSEDLFSANEITMVNIWATWCGHCIEELPQLGQIHNRLQNIGCGIIGVLEDSDDDDAVEEAKQLISNAGVTYPVVKMTDEMEEVFPSNALPISYFVNRNGEIIGIPVEGALVDKYYEAVEDLLAGGTETDIVTTSPGEMPGVADYESQNFIPVSDENSNYPDGASADRGNATEYRIICVDENGQPVAGCTVQFCSDDTCLLGKTDENGIAAFQEPPGHYTVHLLKPPAGYAKDSTEYIVYRPGGLRGRNHHIGGSMKTNMIKCPACGASVEPNGQSVVECPYCGTKISLTDDDNVIRVVNEAEIIKSQNEVELEKLRIEQQRRQEETINKGFKSAFIFIISIVLVIFLIVIIMGFMNQ